MYTFQEAEKEFAENEKESMSMRIITRLPSVRIPALNRKQRAPSFFTKIFSSTKMDQVQSEMFNPFREDEEEDEEANPAIKRKAVPKIDEEDSSHPARDNTEQEEEKDDGNEDDGANENDHDLDQAIEEIEPPMPNIGRPVNMTRLFNRTKNATAGMEYIMEQVKDDIDDSIRKARNIPVSSEFDRVQVTKEISQRMAEIRTNKGISEHVNQNMREIQAALNYRKSGLIMMNFNYAQKIVRVVEPIYVNEARSITTFK